MKINGLRWWVIALIALATIINYIDRQALSVLWPDIVEDLFPDESALERKQIYANIYYSLFLCLWCPVKYEKCFI